jgi:peptidoglycan/LPS O-acetylase OafA/YrhL
MVDPLFLCHWPMAVFVAALIGETTTSPTLLLTTLPLALAFSVAANRLVEAPVRALRSMVRKSASRSPAPLATEISAT